MRGENLLPTKHSLFLNSVFIKMKEDKKNNKLTSKLADYQISINTNQELIEDKITLKIAHVLLSKSSEN